MNRTLRRRHATAWWLLAPLLVAVLAWLGMLVLTSPPPGSPDNAQAPGATP